MKLTKKMLRRHHKKALKNATQENPVGSFRSWTKQNGKQIIDHFKSLSSSDLDYTDNCIKLLENHI